MEPRIPIEALMRPVRAPTPIRHSDEDLSRAERHALELRDQIARLRALLALWPTTAGKRLLDTMEDSLSLVTRQREQLIRELYGRH